MRLALLVSIMRTALDNLNDIAVYAVYNSVYVIYASAPVARQVTAQALGLPYPSIAVPVYVFYNL